jgi:cell division transport system ATP-binding protein
MEEDQVVNQETNSRSEEEIIENATTVTNDFNKANFIIFLKNVDVYQKKLLILPKVSLHIHKGELVYLIGKSGTGKSSILKMLIADERAIGDEALIAGYDLKTIKPKQIPLLRRKMGLVFQDYQLLSDKTVIENLLLMLKASGWKNKDEMLQRAEDVLEMVGLSTKDFKYPHQLSGGEQQRVCIARALLNSPEVILADEPTGNLDPITSQEIFKLFMDINLKGTTVLIATHDFMMINEFPHRTILIENTSLIDSML